MRFQKQVPTPGLQITGWGKEPGQRKQRWYQSVQNPEQLSLVWSYPLDIAQDAWDYRNKRLGSGLRVPPGPSEPTSGQVVYRRGDGCWRVARGAHVFIPTTPRAALSKPSALDITSDSVNAL